MMKTRKISILFAIAFLLIFGSETASATQTSNMLHYKFNHVYPERQDLVHLQRIAKKLKADPQLILSISSHACSIGSNDVNMRVSKMRAEIISTYLGKQGVPQQQVTTNWQGEESPLADNSTEDGRSVNRRSAFTFIKNGSPIANDQPFQVSPKENEEPPIAKLDNSSRSVTRNVSSHTNNPSEHIVHTESHPTQHINYSPKTTQTHTTSPIISNANTTSPITSHTQHSNSVHSNNIQSNSNFEHSNSIIHNNTNITSTPSHHHTTNSTSVTPSTHVRQEDTHIVTTHRTTAPTPTPLSDDERLKAYENVEYVEINVDDIYQAIQEEKMAAQLNHVETYTTVSDTFSPEETNIVTSSNTTTSTNSTVTTQNEQKVDLIADTFSPEEKTVEVKTTEEKPLRPSHSTRTETVSVSTSKEQNPSIKEETTTSNVSTIPTQQNMNSSSTTIISQQNEMAAMGIGEKQTYKLKLVNEENGTPLDRDVEVIIGGKTQSFTPNANGEIEIPVHSFNENTDFYVNGFFHSSEKINSTTTAQTVKLKPIKVGNKLTLNNLYFQSGNATILGESYPELERLYRSLEKNKNVRVEIGGHINVPHTRPDDISQRQLQISIDRAKAVYDYLIGKGIRKDRVDFHGYGNSEMLYPQAKTDLERAANRRVEVKIMK